MTIIYCFIFHFHTSTIATLLSQLLNQILVITETCGVARIRFQHSTAPRIRCRNTPIRQNFISKLFKNTPLKGCLQGDKLCASRCPLAKYIVAFGGQRHSPRCHEMGTRTLVYCCWLHLCIPTAHQHH